MIDARDANHVIWGKPELLHDDNSSVVSSSYYSAPSEGIAPMFRKSHVPYEIQHHLDHHVLFQEESGSSAGGSHIDIGSQIDERVPGLNDHIPSAPSQQLLDPAQLIPATLFSELPEEENEDTYDETCPSIGSKQHDSGDCKPCLYNSKAGCLNGRECLFCHFPHTRKNRPRPCKAKRTQCKQIANMLYTAFDESSREFQEASHRLSNESTYMRMILGGTLRNSKPSDAQDIGDPIAVQETIGRISC